MNILAQSINQSISQSVSQTKQFYTAQYVIGESESDADEDIINLHSKLH